MGELWARLNDGQKKIFSYLLVALVIGVGILILQPTKSSPTLPKAPDLVSNRESETIVSVQEQLECDLKSILNVFLGGKYVEVFLTMEKGHELIIAFNITEEERYSTENLTERRITSNPILLRNEVERKEVPLVLEKIEPIVRGVLIVVDYEPQVELQLAIAKAAATALQIPMYRIEVLFKQ